MKSLSQEGGAQTSSHSHKKKKKVIPKANINKKIELKIRPRSQVSINKNFQPKIGNRPT